jgi:tRNA(adenine34) deaminase
MSADAEMQALLGGGEALWKRHDRAVLFTTVEPCPMCLGAAVMADMPHIVFASHDAVAGCREIVETVPYVRRHIRTYVGGVLEDEARMLMQRFDPAWFEYVRGGT